MKTGYFIYWDKTSSVKFDAKKKLKGIVVVEDDYHTFVLYPELIKDVDWYDGKKKCEERFATMPSLRQCKAIYDNKALLNKSLVAAGFAPIDGEVIWSSTESDFYYAWRVDMSSGSRLSNYGKTGTYYVRPVLALKL